MKILTLRIELQNRVQNGSSLHLKDIILSSICSHWWKLTRQKIEVEDIISSICNHTYWGLIKRLMLKNFQMQPCWKLKLSMRRSDVQHQNGRLETICNLPLEKALTHQQLILHFLFIKQSTLECSMLWRCAKNDEVRLLQKVISIELHQKHLLQYGSFLS